MVFVENTPVAGAVSKRLRPLYATGFVHSFVLWYSIEKLFMRSVGLDDYLITIATLVYIVVMMVANIPLGCSPTGGAARACCTSPPAR